MSTIPPVVTDPAPTPDAPTGDPETFDAEYVKKLREEAAGYRTKAKANAGAAEKLAAIEEANKTEAQKAADLLVAAQSEATQARADALRFKIAAKFQVSDEDAELFLTGADEDTLTKQAQRLAGLETERKKNGTHVPKEGTNPPATGGDDAQFARSLLSGPQ